MRTRHRTRIAEYVWILLGGAALLVTPLGGCDSDAENAAEDAADTVDDAVDEAGDAVEDAADEVEDAADGAG